MQRVIVQFGGIVGLEYGGCEMSLRVAASGAFGSLTITAPEGAEIVEERVDATSEFLRGDMDVGEGDTVMFSATGEVVVVSGGRTVLRTVPLTAIVVGLTRIVIPQGSRFEGTLTAVPPIDIDADGLGDTCDTDIYTCACPPTVGDEAQAICAGPKCETRVYA
ncbi:MAG: hypothetical protein AAB592_05870 [Patescibacteria group bacterium]